MKDLQKAWRNIAQDQIKNDESGSLEVKHKEIRSGSRPFQNTIDENQTDFPLKPAGMSYKINKTSSVYNLKNKLLTSFSLLQRLYQMTGVCL